MGIETSPLDVEESTEPPICSCTKERHLSPTEALCNVEHESHNEKKVSCTSTELPGCSLDASTHSNDNEGNEYPCRYAHTINSVELATILQVDLQNGLSSVEAASRLQRDGPNRVRELESVSIWKILLRQVSNSLTLVRYQPNPSILNRGGCRGTETGLLTSSPQVLLIAMAVSFGIKDYIEGGVITAVILLNIVIGFLQDYRAEKTILSLHRLSAPVCKVIRDGRTISVKAESLVVGDIVQLAVGDIVPADLRVVDGMNISMDEALLTGESLPVVKNPHLTFSLRDIPIADRTNMAYSGCGTTQGRATGIVIATGMMTEVGKIAELLRVQTGVQNSNPIVRVIYRAKSTIKNLAGLVGTPLQIQLNKFALLLFALAVLLAIIVFSVDKWHVEGEVLIYGICVAVAVVPESLIAVLTITVAVGTKEMAKGNVIVRKLQCLEAVGGVTNICSDKTGTLTQGKMIARTVWIPEAGTFTVHRTTDPYDPTSGVVKLGDEVNSEPESLVNDPVLHAFLTAIALCNLAVIHNDSDSVSSGKDPTRTGNGNWTAIGEPTEIALQVLAMRFGYGKAALLQQGKLKLLTEYPFDSAIKRMTVVYSNLEERFDEVYTKGAPEAVIPRLSVSEEVKQDIKEMSDRMAGEGLRVLCVAYKKISSNEKTKLSERNTAESNLQFAGLVGLYDPPRVETAAAVRKCQMAGITVHMLTGDHIRTATAIASEVGILDTVKSTAKSARLVMAAEDFDRLSDAEIDGLEELPLVIARCSPTTKVRMVEAMHRRHAFCVMTGDGVNDSPALKRADVGIAMGKNGSDVAKEAADMVLTDDNFSSIVMAVEEGRRLFDNIQKFLMHLLISNISQVILLLIALAFKDREGNSVFPLSPLEILWSNLITSSFLALGLGLEEAQPDIMYRPPHDLRQGVFTRELILDKMIYGTFMGSLCLVSFVCVIYGAGSGESDLGDDCNEGWNDSCHAVFRARATTYATLTFLLLVTAWEVKHFARSLFNLDPAAQEAGNGNGDNKFSIIFRPLWRNRFLFWAIIAGFVVTFPVIYLPAVNELVFKHHGITWEWGIVFGCVAIYLVLVESWKGVKRAFEIGSGKNRVLTAQDAEMRVGLTVMTVEKRG